MTNAEYKVDYHIHSYFSDGTMKPTDIVKMYAEQDYDIIALTDHDGVDGINEAIIAGEALNLSVVPGIELSCETEEGTKIHMLGYHIDIENQQLLDRLRIIREARAKRNDELLRVINEKGYALTMNDVISRTGQTYFGKPNFVRAMVKKGYIDSFDQAFAKDGIMNSPEVKALKKEKVSPEEAISLIKEAGGLSVLAHPMKIENWGEKGSEDFFNRLDEFLRVLKKAGLKGLECFHPSANEKESGRLAALAGKYHLHITSGSDFHG